jgi:hypothetical protein
MDATDLISLSLSIISLVATAFLALSQNSLQRRLNNSPAIIELLSQFRSTKLIDNFQTVCGEIGDYDPEKGLIGLPPEFRAKAYDINPVVGPEFLSVFEVHAAKAASMSPDVGRKILEKWYRKPF